jgi:phenylacetate-CoA ligase
MSYPLIRWPNLLTGDAATLALLINQLEQTQRMPVPQLIRQQMLQLKEMLKHHYEHSPHLRARMDLAGITVDQIHTLSDLARIPVITKADIQIAGDSFNSIMVPESHKPVGLASTSGSTGQPVDVKKTRINQLFWQAMAIRDHAWFKRDYRGKLASIRATVKEIGTSDAWGQPMSILFRTGPALRMPLTTDTHTQIKLLEEFQPDVLIAHAGVLGGLVDIWEKNGFNLPELKHIKSMGDNCHDDLRARIRAVTGLSPEDNYSCSEVGCIAIQCPVSGQYHIMSETLIVEVLDSNGRSCQPGEIGRVVVTDLHNAAAPVIRYDLGDHAEVGTPCTCGRTLPTLKRILGRERNLFCRPDGSKFWPKAGRYKMVEVADVRQWQLIQHSLDLIEVNLVTDDPLTDLQIIAMQDLIRAEMSLDCQVRVTEHRTLLPLSTSGKFEESICLIRP